MPITKDPSQTKRSVQNVLVKSYDEDFDILAVELVGYDSDAGVLRRLKVNAAGETVIDTTSLDARYVNVTGDTMTGALVITPTADGTSILNVTQADTTSVLNVDTTNGRVGIGTTGPGYSLSIGDRTGDEYISIETDTAGTGGILFSDDAGNNEGAIFYEHNGDEMWFRTSDTRQVTIDSNGNVGIGTTGPADLLHIYKDQNGTTDLQIENPNSGASAVARLILSNDNTGIGAVIRYNSTGAANARDFELVNNDAAGDILFYFNGGYNVTFAQEGNVGIGTTGPGAKLEIQTGAAATKGLIIKGAASQSANYFEVNTSGGSGGDLMVMDSSGNIGIGAVSPSGKLHIDQSVADAAIPVLYLDQADVSEEIAEIVSTAGVGNAIELVGGKTLTTTEFIKVTINGNTRYIPAGTIA